MTGCPNLVHPTLIRLCLFVWEQCLSGIFLTSSLLFELVSPFIYRSGFQIRIPDPDSRSGFQIRIPDPYSRSGLRYLYYGSGSTDYNYPDQTFNFVTACFRSVRVSSLADFCIFCRTISQTRCASVNKEDVETSLKFLNNKERNESHWCSSWDFKT